MSRSGNTNAAGLPFEEGRSGTGSSLSPELRPDPFAPSTLPPLPPLPAPPVPLTAPLSENAPLPIKSPGGYQLVSKLGAGGMADIYLAVQRGEGDFKRLVVIKKVQGRHLESRKLVTMFYDEAQIVASLSHPHIVKIFDLRRVDDDVSIAMEYVDGEPLSLINRTLKANALFMPLPVVMKLMLDACDALHTAHTATSVDGQPLRVIHRDVSPQNLMLDGNGYLKLIDFGIAKTAIQSEMTSPGGIKGKLSYLAPETFRTRDIDERVDVYGLGIVFYELLLQEKAIEIAPDAPIEEVMKTVLGFHPGAISTRRAGLPPELDSVITSALAADCTYRYPTMEHFAAGLRAVAPLMGGVASATEVRRWFQGTFKARLEKRRAFEKEAFARADAEALRDRAAGMPLTKVASSGRGQETPSQVRPMASTLAPLLVGSGSQSGSMAGLAALQAATHGGRWPHTPHTQTPQTQAPQTQAPQMQALQPQAQAPQAQTPQVSPVAARGRPYWILAFAFALFVGGAFVVRALFFRERGAPAVAVKSDPSVPVVAPSAQTPSTPAAVPVLPSAPVPSPDGDEDILPDGSVSAQLDPAKRAAALARRLVKRPPPRSPVSPPSAVASAPASAPPVPSFDPPPPEPPVVAAPVVVAPPPVVVAPPPVAVPAPVAPVKNWMSGSGGWSGAQVLEQGCTRCHAVDVKAKTRRQWERFYQRDLHTKNGDLDRLFSDAEQSRALQATLMRLEEKNASGVAGVK